MKLLRLIALTLSVIGSASAASITYNSSATATFAPSDLLFSPDIPLFDPSLGVLNEVLIEFEGTFEGDFSFQNQSNSAGTLNGSATSEFVLIGPGLLGNLVVLNPAIAFSGPVAANSTRNITGASASDSGSYSSTQAAVLAAFTGIGNVAFTGSATQTGAPVLNFSPSQYNQSVSGLANLAVTYTYTTEDGPPGEIPEPATWAFMMGGGLILLATARLRRPRP